MVVETITEHLGMVPGQTLIIDYVDCPVRFEIDAGSSKVGPHAFILVSSGPGVAIPRDGARCTAGTLGLRSVRSHRCGTPT